jgi:hypothetical protein
MLRRPPRIISTTWRHFDREDYEEGGQMRARARCRRCTRILIVVIGGGTGHLQRHIEWHDKHAM